MSLYNTDAFSQAETVVGEYVERKVEELETKFGVLAQIFFSQIGQMDKPTITEFLENQAKPLLAEIDSYLDF